MCRYTFPQPFWVDDRWHTKSVYLPHLCWDEVAAQESGWKTKPPGVFLRPGMELGRADRGVAQNFWGPQKGWGSRNESQIHANSLGWQPTSRHWLVVSHILRFQSLRIFFAAGFCVGQAALIPELDSLTSAAVQRLVLDEHDM